MIDLHMHSIYSDGQLDIGQLLIKLKEKNIDFFSLTDHNTIIGNYEIIQNQLHIQNNLKFVSGIELSAEIDTGTCHILGYNIDINNQYLKNKLLELNEMEKYNLLLVINYLKEIYKIEIPTERIIQIFSKIGSFNNVTVSKLLVEFGYALTVEDAFNLYIKEAKKMTKCYKKEFSPFECINIIKMADGIPVLAHNYQLKKNFIELKNYLVYLKQIGLIGLECYHSGFTQEETNINLYLAEKFNLLVTGGSDYHGECIKPNIELGTGKNNLLIKKLSIEQYLTGKLKYN